MSYRSEILRIESIKRVEAARYIESLKPNRYHSLMDIPENIFYLVAEIIDKRTDIILHEFEPSFFKIT